MPSQSKQTSLKKHPRQKQSSPPRPAPSTPAVRRALPVVTLVMSAWALLPPYSGPRLNTETRVEVADHVVPALLLLVLAIALLLGRRRAASPTLLLMSGFMVLLAGGWMVATHVPLVAQATRGDVTATWAAAIYHMAPSLAVFILGLVWVVAYWSDAPS